MKNYERKDKENSAAKDEKIVQLEARIMFLIQLNILLIVVFFVYIIFFQRKR